MPRHLALLSTGSPESPDGEIGRWIVRNPAIVLLDGNLFVHGGISPAYSRLTIADINHQVVAALIGQATGPECHLLPEEIV